ncbi:MAG: hypothetical protein R3F59_08775 [Myxococcota bacterium]
MGARFWLVGLLAGLVACGGDKDGDTGATTAVGDDDDDAVLIDCTDAPNYNLEHSTARSSATRSRRR